MNLDLKWAAHELMTKDGTVSEKTIGAAMPDCDEQTFERLKTVFPEKMEAAMTAGREHRANIEAILDSARQTLIEHPDLFVKLGSRIEYLMMQAEDRAKAARKAAEKSI